MSDDLRQLEERMRSAMRLNFDLLEQGIALVRTDTNRRLEEQEERMKTALAAQRSIIDDGYSRMGALVKDARKAFEAGAGHLTAWLEKLDARVEALEKRVPPAA